MINGINIQDEHISCIGNFIQQKESYMAIFEFRSPIVTYERYKVEANSKQEALEKLLEDSSSYYLEEELDEDFISMKEALKHYNSEIEFEFVEEE